MVDEWEANRKEQDSPKLADHHSRLDGLSLKPADETYKHGIVETLILEYVCQRCGRRQKVKDDAGQIYSPAGTISTIDSHAIPALGVCYIQIAFKTPADFESFLAPTALPPNGELFYWPVTRANGTVASVPIYAFQALQ